MAAEEEEVVVLEAHAEVVAAPLGGVKRLVRHDVDDLHVALAVAALERVLGMQFGRVVVDAELGLDPVLGDVHFSARDERVAADGGHLFEKDDVGAGIPGGDGGGEARTARTDHDDVVVRGLRQFAGGLLEGLLVGLGERHAGLLRSVVDGVDEALGGERGAGDEINVGGGESHDLILEVREDLLGENRVFGVLDDLDVLDLAGVERHGDRDVAVLADARTLGGHRSGHRGGRKADGEDHGDGGFDHGGFHLLFLLKSRSAAGHPGARRKSPSARGVGREDAPILHTNVCCRSSAARSRRRISILGPSHRDGT